MESNTTGPNTVGHRFWHADGTLLDAVRNLEAVTQDLNVRDPEIGSLDERDALLKIAIAAAVVCYRYRVERQEAEQGHAGVLEKEAGK